MPYPGPGSYPSLTRYPSNATVMAAYAAMFDPVTGVLAAPPTTGLVVSAGPAPHTEERWEQGISWIPERCGSAYQLVPWCSVADPANYIAPRYGGTYYRPVGVRFADQCSTLGGALDTERLRRIAEATTPFVIARELWDGAMGQADSWAIQGVTYTNARLADASATVVTGSSATLQGRLAYLEQAAVEASRGQRIMIHLPTVATGDLSVYARREGGNLLTRQDNLVVVDAGYPGTGPAGQAVGATAWAYATSMVQVRMSSLEFIADPSQTVDRATNTVTAWAERVFAATFDPCVHFAVQITL
jgi:hypothetical protein